MTNLIETPVTVPENFIGMQTALLDNVPSNVTTTLTRSWDFYGSGGTAGTTNCVVKFINPSAGNYNWTVFDKLFSNNASKQIMFTLGQPADYLVTRAATGSAYLGSKANMVPDDLVGWSQAVTAIVSRAKNTFGRTGLIWELWNEIDQVASFNDTVSLLGPYTKATVAAIKAVDPTAIILAPSLASGSTTASTVLVNYLVASDGASGKASSYVDGVAIHEYVFTLAQANTDDNPLEWAILFKNFKSILKNAGYDLPVFVGESGVIAADTNGGLKHKRRLFTYAALGAKCFIGYRYDDASYPISGYVTQWNEAAAILKPGSVITSFIPGVAGLKITVDGTGYVI